MVRKTVMLIAGETSGDLLGSELVPHLRRKLTDLDGAPSPDRQPLRTSLQPEFFGAGGRHMAAAGVQLAVDMADKAVVGLWEVVTRYREIRRTFHRLLDLTAVLQPHAIVCIDYSGFNLRFARAIRERIRAARGTFSNWRPWLVQYVSPQVWASRPGRAKWLETNSDLLLSIIPFEKEWYRQHAPKLRVEFLGHPIMERYGLSSADRLPAERLAGAPLLALLPGSRAAEIQRHLPVMLDALARLSASKPGLRACLVLPNEGLMGMARSMGLPPRLATQVGSVDKVLSSADLAIASTGTVTLECAYWGVPTVALYRTSWATYTIGKRLVYVKFLAMPNLLANEQIMPEFIQGAATGENLARAALDFLENPERIKAARAKLAKVVQGLGGPGASARAADCIVDLLEGEPRPIRATLNLK